MVWSQPQLCIYKVKGRQKQSTHFSLVFQHIVDLRDFFPRMTRKQVLFRDTRCVKLRGTLVLTARQLCQFRKNKHFQSFGTNATLHGGSRMLTTIKIKHLKKQTERHLHQTLDYMTFWNKYQNIAVYLQCCILDENLRTKHYFTSLFLECY